LNDRVRVGGIPGTMSHSCAPNSSSGFIRLAVIDRNPCGSSRGSSNGESSFKGPRASALSDAESPDDFSRRKIRPIVRATARTCEYPRERYSFDRAGQNRGCRRIGGGRRGESRSMNEAECVLAIARPMSAFRDLRGDGSQLARARLTPLEITS